MGRGDSGKQLERAVKSVLDFKSKRSHFYYYRFPDARTCNGRLGKQPGDFLIWQEGKPDIILDPKELKKGQRLNFKSRCSQMPKMNRAKLAGVESYFLVHSLETDLYHVLSRNGVQAAKDGGFKSIVLANGFETLDEAMEVILS